VPDQRFVKNQVR